MNKIALIGISGSGKDYLVSYMTDKMGFTRVSFSDQLKKIAKFAFPWMDLDYPPIAKEQPLTIQTSIGEHINLTPRQIWLTVNNLRSVEDGLFVRMLHDEVSGMSGNIVISDVRTSPEYDYCKANGFKFIRITPAKLIYEPNEFDLQQQSMISDYEFVNNFNGVEEFRSFISTVIEPDYQNPYRNIES